MPEPTPQQVIAGILEQLGIRRVVSVDNDYLAGKAAIDSTALWSQLNMIAKGRIQVVLGNLSERVYSEDTDVFESRFKRFWEGAAEEEKNQLHYRIQAANMPDVEYTEEDLAAIERIPILFERFTLIKMGYEEWLKKAPQIYDSAPTEPTLILFDRDFRITGARDNVGIDLARDALNHPNNKDIVCCLVSHLFHETSLNQEWADVAKEIGFPQSKVVPIPKEILRPKPALVATLIKLAAVAPYYDKMRERVLEITTASAKEAHDDVKLLNFMDMDRMIFRASDKEGVWEPDTLVRVFGISLKTITRSKIITDLEMRSASAFMRKLSRVTTPPGDDAGDSVWKFNRAENYEEGDTLNGLHRPTDLGDIYQKGEKKFILIAPPCDLMVRTAQGYRGNGGADLVKEVTLAEIVVEDDPGRVGCRVDFFERGKQTYVHFKKTVSARLMCLDLCVLNEGGEAKFSLNDQPSDLLIPAWEKRHAIIRKELERLLKKLSALNPDARHRDQVGSLLARADNLEVFTGKLSLANSSIEFNFKRIGRLLPPRATSLVKSYCEYLNRDAFEHTFGDTAGIARIKEQSPPGTV